MYGKDIERIIKLFDKLKDTTYDQIKSFTNENSYRIKSEAQHAGTAFGNCTPLEKEHNASNPMIPIMDIYNELEDDFDKMKEMKENHFHDVEDFNNSIGSPWKEVLKLKNVIEDANEYADSNNPFPWTTQKASMLSYLNCIIHYTIDAEYSLTIYQEYIQRGYDHKYNDNEPSITWKYSLEDDTMGNLFQEYEENVNIKKKDNMDIY